MKPLTGRKVLIILVVSFGVVFGVNGFFIYEAVNTFRGEDENKPYLQGLDYNDTLKAHAEQAALGWHAAIAATRDVRGGAVLVVDLVGKDRKPISGLNLQAQFHHPSDSGRDRALPLTAVEAGRYAGRLPDMSMGAWDVVVRADGQTPFEAVRRVWLR